MDSRIETCLADNLGRMTKEKLEEFLHQLSHKKIHIFTASEVPVLLQELNNMKMASHLVSWFGEQKAWELALKTWEEMGLNELRAEATRMLRIREINQNQSNPIQLPKTEGLCQNFTELQLLHRDRSEKVLQRSTYSGVIEGPKHFIAGTHLFDVNPGNEQMARTVMLYGEAGIGKSTVAKQIREDWMKGLQYRDRFQHVFYINCRELDQSSFMTLTELIAKHSAAPVITIEEILSWPEQMLFILDGLDEHRMIWEVQSSDTCLLWYQRKPVHTLLKSLLERTVLPESCLLVTARSTVVENLIPVLENAYCVEILGFSESSRKDYFYKYFTNEHQARRTLRVVESNPALWTLCHTPWVSWLVCTCLKQQMERGQELSLKCQTTTALCLQFLTQNLPGQSFGAQLRGLCSMAAEGTSRRYTRFSGLASIRHSLDDSVMSTFLKMGILQNYPNSLHYSFTQMCFQEFFTAMNCVLWDFDEQMHHWDILRTAKKLLSDYGWSLMFRAPVTQFLFGLLGEQGGKQMERIFNCTLSRERKWELLQWTQEVWQKHSTRRLHSLHLLYSLYETQDKEFLTKAMDYFKITKMVFKTDQDLLVFMFCVKFCHHLISLQLNTGSVWTRSHPEIVLFSEIPIPDSWWQSLFSIHGVMESLQELDLSGNFLSQSVVQSLCQALKYLHCRLETLWLERCGLTASCCQDLASMLSSSPNLREVDLRQNDLGDLGVELLCEGLWHPSCQLRHLCLDQAKLSEKVKGMLRKLNEEKPQLQISEKWTEPLPMQPRACGGERRVYGSLALQTSEEGKPHMNPKNVEDGFQGPTGPVAAELVDKERILYRFQFPASDSYYWPNTGLHFVLKKPVTIEIEFCDWSQFLDENVPQQSWMVVGPLFDIKADPETVTTVYLPHFVSLQGGYVDISQFHVAHFKKEGMVLEKPDRVKPDYVVLENPNFSPMGVLLRIFPVTRSFIPITTTVLLYHKSHPRRVTFHLYLIPNDYAIQQDIDNKEAAFQFVQIRKPPPLMPLHVGSHYTVSASQYYHINSPELKLCYRQPKSDQLFSEIYVDNMELGVTLEIRSKRDGTTVWETLVRPGDFRSTDALDPPSSAASGSPPDARNVSHFLEQNWNKLITRVITVDPVLDMLLGPVLTQEEYETIRTENTTHNKMRRLLCLSPSWDLARKNRFFQALQETHRHLIEELLEESGMSF